MLQHVTAGDKVHPLRCVALRVIVLDKVDARRLLARAVEGWVLASAVILALGTQQLQKLAPTRSDLDDLLASQLVSVPQARGEILSRLEINPQAGHRLNPISPVGQHFASVSVLQRAEQIAGTS